MPKNSLHVMATDKGQRRIFSSKHILLGEVGMGKGTANESSSPPLSRCSVAVVSWSRAAIIIIVSTIISYRNDVVDINRMLRPRQ